MPEDCPENPCCDELPEFVPVKEFVLITKGFIPSCDCCGVNAPVRAGEYVNLRVTSDVDPSGYQMAVIVAANRDITEYSTWVYTIAIDKDVPITKEQIRGIGCC